MCGIAGSVSWQQQPNLETVKKMVASLHHRGPDAANSIQLGPAALGHARLSIIDISHAATQPMFDVERKFCIVFNGEIYNFQELRTQLTALGSNFRTQSDTEIILEAWKQWNHNCIHRLVGMFAFALFDIRQQAIYLVRDRMGEKPLYYYEHKDGVIFASELKAFYHCPEVAMTINPTAVNAFFSLNYLLTQDCIVKGIHKLPPAHYFKFQYERTTQAICYWDLSQQFQQKIPLHMFDESAEQLDDLIKQSVHGQRYADVPLGAFLSGGIDSSTIVSSMVNDQQASASTHTFSIGFHENTYSELEASQQLADLLAVDHHTQLIDVNMAEQLPDIVAVFDEPFADTSMLPTYFLCQYAKQNVKVSLAGDGGDELFAGYTTYNADRLHHWLSMLPKASFAWLEFATERLLPVSFNKVSFGYKLKQFLRGCQQPYQQAHYSWRQIMTDAEKATILSTHLPSANPFLQFLNYYDDVANCHYIDQSCYVDMKTWLVDDIIVKVDQTSMAHSLEVREPFLDHRIVEFAAHLPVQWKLGRENKYILKQCQRRHLPNTILQRAKQGFNAPISHWLANELEPLGKSVTLDPTMAEWFNLAAVEKLWQQHKKHRVDHGYKLFGLINFSLWLANHQTKIGNITS